MQFICKRYLWYANDIYEMQIICMICKCVETQILIHESTWCFLYGVQFKRMRILACSEIDDEVEQENGVWYAVESDPMRAQVIVKEGDDDGQDDEVRKQEQEHEQVPIESTVCTVK